MRKNLALLLLVTFILNSSVFAFTKSDLFDEKLYESFKSQSILLVAERLELIRNKAAKAVSYNCSIHREKELNKIHLASVDIAALLGLDAKVDESVVPRIDEAIKSISCESLSPQAHS